MEFLKLMNDWNGYVPVSKKRVNVDELAKFTELILNESKMPRYRQEYLLNEVITTDRFPDLLGFTLEREISTRYKAAVADWKTYVRVRSKPNFNIFEIHDVGGNDNQLPEVPEKGEYATTPASDAKYEGRIKKYGRQFDISWEALINDILGAFADIPERFANAAIRTEAINVTNGYASATGPAAGLFATAGVTNAGVLALTIANLETTLALMSMQTDENGEPILVRGVHLVVPPALEFTARAIITSALRITGSDTIIPAGNVMSQYGIQVHVDPYLPIVDTSANNDGTWYVFADPAVSPAIQADYLRGNESPEICMKSSNKVGTGGAGEYNAFSGDFESDNVMYRVRVCQAVTQLNPRYAYAQVHT